LPSLAFPSSDSVVQHRGYERISSSSCPEAGVGISAPSSRKSVNCG